MVLAVASALISFGAVASVPVAINYVIESFRPYPQEVGAVLNVYRLVLALGIPFFFQQWGMKVGLDWLFGMAAFFSILVFLGLVVLMLKGPTIRSASLLKSDADES